MIGHRLALAAGAWFAYRHGWQRLVQRHPIQSAAIALVTVAVLAYPVYYTASPLFSGGKTVCEASPIAGASAGSERCEGVAQAAERPVAATAADGEPAPTENAAAQPASTLAPAAANSAAAVLAQGEFEGADDFHFGRGEALLILNGATHTAAVRELRGAQRA